MTQLLFGNKLVKGLMPASLTLKVRRKRSPANPTSKPQSNHPSRCSSHKALAPLLVTGSVRAIG